MLMSDNGLSQAAGLHEFSRRTPVRVIAVTGGKGGVGKTNVSINLGVALAMSGERVLLLDADLGLANIDVLLGLQPSVNLSHVIKGDCALDDILVEGPHGLRIIPASSGVKRMAELSHAEHAGLIRAFSSLAFNPEILLIDTAAGISDSVVTFVRAAHEVLVVVCDEPASITDAYAMIKILHREYGIDRFRVLANMVQTAQEGSDLYKKLAKVADRFLDVNLDYVGAIPYDEFLRKAVQKQRALVDAYPRSKSALSFGKVAQKVTQWPTPRAASGRIEFFVERLFTNNGGRTTVGMI